MNFLMRREFKSSLRTPTRWGYKREVFLKRGTDGLAGPGKEESERGWAGRVLSWSLFLPKGLVGIETYIGHCVFHLEKWF